MYWKNGRMEMLSYGTIRKGCSGLSNLNQLLRNYCKIVYFHGTSICHKFVLALPFTISQKVR